MIIKTIEKKKIATVQKDTLPALASNNIEFDKLQRLKSLGKGSFGEVFLMKDVHERLIVMKVIKIEDEDILRDAKAEVKALSAIKHPNVIQFQGQQASKRSKKIFIQIEQADGGDLHMRIEALRKINTQMLLTDVQCIFSQICNAVKHCHDYNLIHRDLKSANVLLDSDGLIKLADFGFSKVLERSGTLAKSTFGVCHQFPPETILEKGFGKKSDIWQLGTILYEMLMLRPPFIAKDVDNLLRIIINEPHPSLERYNRESERFPEFLSVLVDLMLVKNIDDRPTITQVIDVLKTNNAWQLPPSIV